MRATSTSNAASGRTTSSMSDALTMMHFTPKFEDRLSASAAARQLRSRYRFKAQVRHCDDCKAWHIAALEDKFDETDMLVLQKVAMGLRDHEIGLEIGENLNQVSRRMRNFADTLDALSRAHLIVLAINYGLIDPHSIANLDQRKVGAST
jgi:DNA-binding NarL/FixJ family response regulator